MAVHPHARGEHHILGHIGHGRPRFIPTHVGNTTSVTGPVKSCAVHPHARGEHAPFRARTTARNGSSPRTWGTPPWTSTRGPLSRFIPTHVGNTGPARSTPCRGAVHPHARGEHTSSISLISMRNSGPRFSTKSGTYFELLKITVTGGPLLAKNSPVAPRHTPPEFGGWRRLCAPRTPVHFSLARP